MRAMSLAVAEVRDAKPDPARDYKLADGGGLYPEVLLAEAREHRKSARRLLRENTNPVSEAARQRQEAVSAAGASFRAAALAWHED